MTWTDILVAITIGGAVVGASPVYLSFINAGNPRNLAIQYKVYRAISSAAPTTLFRWREGKGLWVTYYDQTADREHEVPSGIQLDRYSPTLIAWFGRWGDDPLPAEAVARRAAFDLQIRIIVFFWLFLGIPITLARLAFEQTWHWAVAIGFFAVYQLVYARTGRHIWFVSKLHFATGIIGVLIYLQGGIWETTAVCGVGLFFTLATIATWAQITREERDPVLHAQLREFGSRR